ncbi:MAG: hypothetical protein JXB26_10025 [Candidatus Aminicenantes bacterium]|nr:hypothetical protein [Candidatus Aminicenantes bacterium]
MDLTYILAAFGGGILGAAIGGMNAFILCGLSCVVGTALAVATGDSSFNQVVTWGPFLAPHIAFAGGAAASAYAARRGKLSCGRDVLSPLYGLESPGILLAGGIFGVFGCLVKVLLDLIPKLEGLPWTNTMALSVGISGLLARLVFGKTGLSGCRGKGTGRWKRKKDQDWQPWPSSPWLVLIVAFGVSLVSYFTSRFLPGSVGLVFGISAVSLFLFHGGARIPVFLHTALCAEFAVFLTNDLGWGIFFGLAAAFFAELFAGIFLNCGDTHIDPPALAISAVFGLFPLFSILGIMALTGITSLLLAFLMGAAGMCLLFILRRT